MPTVASPYGLIVRKSMGSRRCTGGLTAYPITVDPGADALYYGAPVALISGGIKAIGTSPTSTASANSPVGTLQQVEWEDNFTKRWSPSFPGGYFASARRIVAYVNDDPDLCFLIQASTNLTLAHVGMNAPIINPKAGGAYGRSTAQLGVPAADATLALRIIRVLDPGSGFPDCIVQWNNNIHQFRNGFAV